MGNDATSFAVVGGCGGNRSIQASQGRWQSISAHGCGAQRARPIKQQQWAPLDGQGDDLDSVIIAEKNLHQQQWDQDDV
jgi:hypothetical protein